MTDAQDLPACSLWRQELQKLLQRPRVEDVLELQPAAPCLAEAKAHELQSVNGVCIRAKTNLHAQVFCQAADMVIDIVARRVGIELDEVSAVFRGA